jgi:hypothetical protein
VDLSPQRFLSTNLCQILLLYGYVNLKKALEGALEDALYVTVDFSIFGCCRTFHIFEIILVKIEGLFICTLHHTSPDIAM